MTREEADILKIRTDRRDNLSISRDTGDEDEPIAVLLHIPDLQEHDHSHIELSIEQCADLHGWLGRFLEDHPPKSI